MVVNTKKLSPIHADIVDNMIDTANQLGIDIIELLWTPFNGAPVYAIQEIHGYKFPIMGNINVLSESTDASEWVEGILKFFPDGKGRCWGYCYDTPDNRHLIKTTLSTGWYRIVDLKLREEIIEEAKIAEIPTDHTQRTDVQIKKSKREVEAEKHAKELAERLEETKKKMKKIEEELALARNEKQVRVEKRLSGVKIENREELIEQLKG